MKNLVRFIVALLVLAVAAGCGPKAGGTGGVGKAGEGESPIFTIEKTVGGKQVKQAVRGEEGKFGFEDVPFVATQQEKTVWHFFNSPDLPGNRLVVTGENETTKEKVEIARVTLSQGMTPGASASATALMLFPSKGLWRLDVSVGEKPFGTITIRVD